MDSCLYQESDVTFPFDLEIDLMGKGSMCSRVQPVLGSPELSDNPAFEYTAHSPLSAFYEQPIMIPESFYTQTLSPQTGSGTGSDHGILCSQASGPAQARNFTSPNTVYKKVVNYENNFVSSRQKDRTNIPSNQDHRIAMPSTSTDCSSTGSGIKNVTDHGHSLASISSAVVPSLDQLTAASRSGHDTTINDDLEGITGLLETQADELSPYITSGDPDLSMVLSEIFPNTPNATNFNTTQQPFGESSSQRPITQNAFRGNLGVDPFPAPPPLSPSFTSTESQQNNWARDNLSDVSFETEPGSSGKETFNAQASNDVSICTTQPRRRKRKGGMSEDEIQIEIDKKKLKDKKKKLAELGPCQIDKRERRKKQNREAAARCRTKKKSEFGTLAEEEQKLTCDNNKLEEEIRALKEELQVLTSSWNNHICTITQSQTSLVSTQSSNNMPTLAATTTATCQCSDFDICCL